jgi:pilus assembly protein CpaF
VTEVDDLLELVAGHDDLATMDRASRRLALRDVLSPVVAPELLPSFVGRVADEIDGYGPLSELMSDPEVTDVLVNGPFNVWVERAGCLRRTGVRFASEAALRRLVERLLGDAGAQADTAHPIGDARSFDGARVHVVMPPVGMGGPLVSIRRFPRQALSLRDLEHRDFMTTEQAELLSAAVAHRRTIAICGATGTGKTTLLGALLSMVSSAERVILIEETPEIVCSATHVVSLVARPSSGPQIAPIELIDLVRAALRMRPDRIVIGEVRGSEALAALGALSTGHEGSMVTIHARSAHDAVQRMADLALWARAAVDRDALVAQANRAFDLVVHLERAESGRRVAEVAQIS